jgi:hypothetical protein
MDTETSFSFTDQACPKAFPYSGRNMGNRLSWTAVILLSTRRKASGGVQATVKEQIPPELMPEIARSLGLRQRFFAEGFAY